MSTRLSENELLPPGPFMKRWPYCVAELPEGFVPTPQIETGLYYVTYGFGSNLEGCYSSFPAATAEEAREIVFKGTHGKHAFIYSCRDWHNGWTGASQAEKYNLREVPLQPQKAITSHNRKYL